MKKILLVLSILVLFMTSGCQNKEEIVKVKESVLESYDVDMSAYKNMSSVDHNFKGITPDTLMKAIENDESAIFYIGYTECGGCQNAVSMIDEVAKELNLVVYYIDCYSEKAPLMNQIEEVVEVLKPILRNDDEGNPGIFTPHVFALVNGEFKDSTIGLEKYDGSEKSREQEINRYRELMQYFE